MNTNTYWALTWAATEGVVLKLARVQKSTFYRRQTVQKVKKLKQTFPVTSRLRTIINPLFNAIHNFDNRTSHIS
jgi:hypothetical protein